MKTCNNESLDARPEEAVAGHSVTYPPLATESRITVDTATAAFHLNRKPQTLRGWACHEDGPVRPVRINGRLAWPVSELIRLQAGVTV